LLNSNSFSQSIPRRAPSALRLLALCLLLLTVTVTVWLLSGSNIFTSPNQTLADLDASLSASSKQLLNKWNSLLRHNDSTAPENLATPTAFYRVDDLVAMANLQEIMPAIDALNKQAEQGRNDPLDCAHSNLARIYEKLGEHKQVIAELDELNKDIVFAGDSPKLITVTKKSSEKSAAIHSSPKNKRITATEVAILARAEALRQVGRLTEAVQEYLKLINLNPNLAVAHQRLGLAAVTDNNLWLAINELQTAAQLDKGDPDTQNDLGLVYQQIGDYKSAKQSFSNAHKIDPKHLSAAVNLANSITNSGDYKSGIAIMRKATLDHPNSPIAHNNLASLIARTNNQTQAAKEFAKAINLDPTLASAHYGLGIALLKLKSYTAAAKEFQTALTLNPGILDLQNKIDLANRCNLRTLAYTQHSFN